jgi:hypothetical protein
MKKAVPMDMADAFKIMDQLKEEFGLILIIILKENFS